MKHRFRYLDEQGRQVEVVDLSALREHIRKGRVDPDTLLYDSLTDEWAPASAHSAYRLLDDPLAQGPEGEDVSEGEGTAKGRGADREGDAKKGGGDGGPRARPSGEADPGGSRGEGSSPDTEDAPDGMDPTDGASADEGFEFPDLDVTLAPDDEIESTDEVVQKLLRERERDRDAHRTPLVTEGYASSSSSADDSTTASDAGSGSSEPPSGDRPPPWGPTPPEPDDEPIRPRRPRSGRSGPASGAGRGARESGEHRRSARRVDVPAWALAVVSLLLVGMGLYGAVRLMNPSGAAEASTGADDTVAGAERTPTNSAWAAAEGGAFRDMVEGVDSLRRIYSVQRIPPAWLGGPYLADADRFPEVREHWTNYLRFVDAVRSQDTVLFRRSFVSRLQEQGVSGPIVPIRLARALETFAESQPARDTVYARMEDLASSALDLHELLVDRADDLVYDPVTEERASRQPILEAWSDDPYLRQSIWSLLDRITANLALLEYDAGAGRSDLTERLFQELRTRSVGRDGGGGGG